jgi:hypothetical protein
MSHEVSLDLATVKEETSNSNDGQHDFINSQGHIAVKYEADFESVNPHPLDTEGGHMSQIMDTFNYGSFKNEHDSMLIKSENDPQQTSIEPVNANLPPDRNAAPEVKDALGMDSMHSALHVYTVVKSEPDIESMNPQAEAGNIIENSGPFKDEQDSMVIKSETETHQTVLPIVIKPEGLPETECNSPGTEPGFQQFVVSAGIETEDDPVSIFPEPGCSTIEMNSFPGGIYYIQLQS